MYGISVLFVVVVVGVLRVVSIDRLETSFLVILPPLNFYSFTRRVTLMN